MSRTAMRAAARRAGEEGALGLADHRVQNAFEPGHGGGVGQDDGAEAGAVHGAGYDGARKGGCDGAHGAAALGLQAVDGGVGVEHRDARPAERRCRGGLAHADPAREADDLHLGALMPARRPATPGPRWA